MMGLYGTMIFFIIAIIGCNIGFLEKQMQFIANKISVILRPPPPKKNL